MNVTIEPRPHYRITLDLDGMELFDLIQSIYEAAQYVDNWRSNPATLRELEANLQDADLGNH